MSWQTVKLGDVCEIISGSTPSTSVKENWGDDYFWATPKDLSSLSIKEISKTDRKISEKGLKSCSANLLPVNSVLFSSRAPIGLVAINKVPIATNQGFKSFIPNTNYLEANYLYYWLKKNKKNIELMGVGATFKEVSKTIVAKIKIPLPPISEQKRIAAILDKADEIRRKREQAITTLEQLAQSIFVEMFGDENVILKKWTVKKLGEILDFITSGSRGWARYYADEGEIFIRVQNVGYNRLILNNVGYVKAPESAEANRTKVEAGDVLLSITADLGRTCVIPNNIGNAYINQHLSILRTKQVLPDFLSAFLASPAGQQQINGRNRQGVKAGLNFDDIKSIIIPLPPIALQEEFAKRINQIEKLKADNTKALANHNALFASLQQQAFSGNL